MASDLAHRGMFEAQHLVDEDRPVHVGIGEAVGFRVKLRMRGLGAHAQGVEIGHQMPPDPVGADDHQRPDRIEHRLLDLIVADDDAHIGGLGPDLVARALHLRRRDRPFAGQRRGQLIGGHRRPVGPVPCGALGLAPDIVFGIAERPEERRPGRIHRRRGHWRSGHRAVRHIRHSRPAGTRRRGTGRWGFGRSWGHLMRVGTVSVGAGLGLLEPTDGKRRLSPTEEPAMKARCAVFRPGHCLGKLDEGQTSLNRNIDRRHIH